MFAWSRRDSAFSIKERWSVQPPLGPYEGLCSGDADLTVSPVMGQWRHHRPRPALKRRWRWCRVWTTEGWSATLSINYEFYSSSKWNYKQQKDVIKWSTRNVCLHVFYWPAQRLAGWRVGFWHKLRLLSVKPFVSVAVRLALTVGSCFINTF